MASSSAPVDGDNETKKKILSQRRCIILAIVGATPSSNAPLQSILQTGFLSSVKSWMDDILSGSIGEFDVVVLDCPSFPIGRSNKLGSSILFPDHRRSRSIAALVDKHYETTCNKICSKEFRYGKSNRISRKAQAMCRHGKRKRNQRKSEGHQRCLEQVRKEFERQGKPFGDKDLYNPIQPSSYYF
jgi:hypothetical protein